MNPTPEDPDSAASPAPDFTNTGHSAFEGHHPPAQPGPQFVPEGQPAFSGPGGSPWPSEHRGYPATEGSVEPVTNAYPAYPAPAYPTPQFGGLVTRPSAFPTAPTEYHQFWRAPRYRWWKGLLALVVGVVSWAAIQVILGIVYAVFLVATGQPIPDVNKTTPGLFLLGNLAVAALLPTAMLLSWLFTGQSPRWLSSVAGGLRWRWLGASLAVFAPIWVGWTGVGLWLSGSLDGLQWLPSQSLFLIVTIVLTTPFQAAAEEYLLRGVANRAVGSWIRPRVVSAVVAGLVSSVIFMLMHGAGDPWLNVFYFSFAACAAVLVWRTGGLEAAIVVHAVNNLVAEATLPFMDISEVFDRSSGVGSPAVLIDIGILVVATVLMLALARRLGIRRVGTPEPVEAPEHVGSLAESPDPGTLPTDHGQPGTFPQG